MVGVHVGGTGQALREPKPWDLWRALQGCHVMHNLRERAFTLGALVLPSNEEGVICAQWPPGQTHSESGGLMCKRQRTQQAIY